MTVNCYKINLKSFYYSKVEVKIKFDFVGRLVPWLALVRKCEHLPLERVRI